MARLKVLKDHGGIGMAESESPNHSQHGLHEV